ncbi:AraC family transcriptional regulator [Sphingobium sp. AP49]|uniref:helix-turn-helix transcriptional regulator n=1 Tax=Sphingobium sp. AP49 TaxID=1144307 RepID=UPI00026ED8E3|nr:AraC family transcriptional regulator [Sphingobium sp. AP49]WHO37294.1 AraC family transcriptional regulator [Sphingobium sp. AP49]
MARASQESAFARIEADLDFPAARVRMIRYRQSGPVDIIGAPSGYRLELGLLPRPQSGQAGFPDRWGATRFEPIGEMFLVPPGEAIRARGEAIDQLAIICEFEPEALAHRGVPCPPASSADLGRHLDIASPAIKASLRRIHDEIRNPGFASDALCELLAMQVALDLARHCRADDSIPAGGLAPWRLRRIDTRLADGSGPPSLDELARLCGLSVRQMTRGYRVSRTRSIGDDIARQQIARARTLLAESMPVKQVAHALGFAAPANFTAAFTRATGETPRQYRQRIAAER